MRFLTKYLKINTFICLAQNLKRNKQNNIILCILHNINLHFNVPDIKFLFSLHIEQSEHTKINIIDFYVNLHFLKF